MPTALFSLSAVCTLNLLLFLCCFTHSFYKFNHQQNEGPAEDIHSYLLAAGRPSRILVSIGATRYTTWGESNFLQNGDKAVVVVYPESKYKPEEIKKMAEKVDFSDRTISALIQTVEM